MISYVVQHVVHPVSKVLGLSPEDLSSTRSANPARTWTLGAYDTSTGFCAGAATSGRRDGREEKRKPDPNWFPIRRPTLGVCTTTRETNVLSVGFFGGSLYPKKPIKKKTRGKTTKKI